jgi:hypothetical protein
MKTIADSLIEEGIKKGELIGFKAGLKKGIASGIKKGERIAEKKPYIIYVKRMIKEGFNNKTIRKLTGFTYKEIDEIRYKMR